MVYSTDDEIAITGGGGSGLASAYFLIKAGHRPEKISIFERNDKPGGHARTIYLQRVSVDELYVIKDYQMTFDKDADDIFLEFEDHKGSSARVRVNKNPDIIPVDIGVCGFSIQYKNFTAMLKDLTDNEGFSFFRHEYLAHIERSINLANNLTIRSDKPLGGQLCKPWIWPRFFRLVRDVGKIVPYCEEKGNDYLRTITVATLLDELKAIGLGQDSLDLFVAFCHVGSGYSDEKFAKISALYLYDFFTLGNFHNRGEQNTIWQYGVSAYVNKMVSSLKEKGVRFVKEPEKNAKHNIYAVQPYDALKLNPALPKIEYTRSPLYIHCNDYFQGPEDSTLTYGKVKGIASATWDVDRMRPGIPDCGGFITFSTPDYETEIEGILETDKKIPLLNEIKGNSHNLCESAVKMVWFHAFADVQAEEKKRDILENHQGKEDKYYCSSSYMNSMLHENAVTSALDVVCMITGEQSKLEGLGFEPSSSKRK